MNNYSNHEPSFEYNPIQTEMYNDISHSTINNNNFRQLSDLTSESENILEESGSIQNSNNNISPEINLNTLQSLRISHSISSPKDNELTLLERMQLIKENTNNDEQNVILRTPPKKQNENFDGYNNNKVEIMQNVFDCTSTDNKNVMVSELDIQITTNKKEEKKQNENHNINIYNNHNNSQTTKNKEKTKKFGLNLNEVFDKKIPVFNKKVLTTEITNNTNISNIIIKPISQRNVTIPSNIIPKYKSKPANNQKTTQKTNTHKTGYVNSSTQTSSNLGIIKNVKKKSIYSSVKKINSKQSFYELIQKMTEKGKRSSSYKKSTHCSSNRSSSITNKTLNTNNSVRYHNCQTASTYENTGSKKRSFLIPSSGLKGKNPSPFITNFKYCSTENQEKKYIQKRPFSQTKKNNIKISITNMNSSSIGRKNVTTNSQKKQPTSTKEKKKYNFNIKILQTIQNNNYHQYHTITENKTKTTNSFFGSHSNYLTNKSKIKKHLVK